MKEIILNSTPIENGIQEYQQLFNGKIVSNNTIYLDNEFAEGHIFFFNSNENLKLITSKITVKKDITIIRKAEEGPWITFCYFISPNDLFLKQLETDNEISLNSINSILATSQHFEKKIVINKGIEVKYVSLFINKNWISKFLQDSELEKYKMLCDPKTPLYRYSNIDNSIYSDLEELLNRDNQLATSGELLTYSLIYRLIYKTITKIFTKERNRIIPNQKDIQALFRIRNILLVSDLKESLKLVELAKEAGMSVSKFSKLFKTIFGKTLSHYQKEQKMKRALNLLITGEYSIFEICNLLEYKNQSKFSSTFKLFFGILPKDVISRKKIKYFFL